MGKMRDESTINASRKQDGESGVSAERECYGLRLRRRREERTPSREVECSLLSA